MNTSERPILFSAEMVRALLSGTKTQTRRIVKPQPPVDAIQDAGRSENGVQWQWGFAWGETNSPQLRDYTCPYGRIGDRLWVRESLYCHYGSVWKYAADDAGMTMNGEPPFMRDAFIEWDDARKESGRNSVPSIHMPRWASRITLEITEIRVQRLQEISEKDAIAEGLWASGFAAGVCHPHGQENCRRCGYASLWERINGKGSWDANAYVWALTFRRIDDDHK